jgi:hypothetical protein
MFTRAIQIQPECVEALRELRLIDMRREKSKGLVALTSASPNPFGVNTDGGRQRREDLARR